MSFKDRLDSLFIDYKTNVDTSALSSIRAGGVVGAVIYPKTVSELVCVVRLFTELSISHRLIGNFTNTLIKDNTELDALISTVRINRTCVNGGEVIAEGGVSFSRLTRILADSGAYVSLPMSGIPGSVGGITRGNAGAYGECCEDVILGAHLYDPRENKTLFLGRDELSLSYRDSIIKKEGLIVLSASFRKRHLESDKIRSELMSYSKKRRQKQPKEPSLGSYFKRPDGDYASRLIDASGLRGLSVGGAAVSDKHAGFIINRGCATSRDILTLAEAVRNTVYDLQGVMLEDEVEIF